MLLGERIQIKCKIGVQLCLEYIKHNTLYSIVLHLNSANFQLYQMG